MAEQLRAVPYYRPPGPTTVLRAKHRTESLAEAGGGVRRGHRAVQSVDAHLGHMAGTGTRSLHTHTHGLHTPGLDTHNLYTRSWAHGLYTLDLYTSTLKQAAHAHGSSIAVSYTCTHSTHTGQHTLTAHNLQLLCRHTHGSLMQQSGGCWLQSSIRINPPRCCCYE